MNSLPPYRIECGKGAFSLEGNYPVFFGSEPIGKVQVLRQGLYYGFHCRCRLTGSVVCRLFGVWEGGEENLGVLIPMGDGFGLDTKLPAKRFPQGEIRFSVTPKGQTGNRTFYPILPEEPFGYIQRLKEGFLDRQNGQLGLAIGPVPQMDKVKPTGQ